MNFTEIFATTRKTAAAAEEQFRSIRRKREGLRRDRDALKARPAVRADVKALIVANIRAQRSQYLQHLETNLGPFIRQPERMQRITFPSRALTIAGVAAPDAEFVAIGDVDQVLAGLFGDQLEAAIGRAVDELPMPENGLSHAEREKQVARLDARIEELDREMEAIVTAAQQAGVVLNLHHVEDF